MSEDNNNNNNGDDNDANAGDNKGQNSEGDNGNNAGTKGNSGNGNNAITQEAYEKRIADLDKRDKAMDDKLARMEKLNEKIAAEGSPTGGQQKQETADEKQKANLVKNFGGCIDGLDKMI